MHILLVLVELTAKAENGEQRLMKMFRIGDAKLVPTFEMATILPELYDTITAADEQEKGTVSQEYNGIMFEVVRCRDYCTTMRYPWNKSNLINLVEVGGDGTTLRGLWKTLGRRSTESRR